MQITLFASQTIFITILSAIMRSVMFYCYSECCNIMIRYTACPATSRPPILRGAMTLSITTLNIKTFIIVTLSIIISFILLRWVSHMLSVVNLPYMLNVFLCWVSWCPLGWLVYLWHNTQRNDFQHCDTQNNSWNVTLRIMAMDIAMLSATMLSVAILSVTNKPIMLSFVMIVVVALVYSHGPN